MEMKLKRETTPFERSSRSSVLNVILSVASRSDARSKGGRIKVKGSAKFRRAFCYRVTGLVVSRVNHS